MQKKKKNKNKKNKLTKREKILIMSGLAFMAIISLFLIYFGFNHNTRKKAYYSYKIRRNIDYKVYLKANGFFEDKYLKSGRQYTSELIDYIDIDFSYLFNDSSVTKYDYTYSISGTIIGEYDNVANGKSELWTKKYNLLDKVSKNYNGTEFAIKENLKIKYSDYDSIVRAFKSKFKLAIDAYLKIQLKIDYKSTLKSHEQVVKGNDVLEISIPLSKATISIDTNCDEDTNKTLFSQLKESNKVFIILGIVIFVLVIIAFVSLYDRIFTNKKTSYKKALDKLMKDYSEIIVEISNPISYENLEILDIKNFDDMVDAEEELKSPILFYEENPGKEGHFIVINGNHAYRYILDKSKYK